MDRISWRAAPQGVYWIDVLVGDFPMCLMVDTGLCDPRNELGIALDPTVYDRLKQERKLSRIRTRVSRDASGRHAASEVAETSAQLYDVANSRPVGPAVRLFVSRGIAKVPSRVGVPFFHHLKGCTVEWNLENQRWSIQFV